MHGNGKGTENMKVIRFSRTICKNIIKCVNGNEPIGCFLLSREDAYVRIVESKSRASIVAISFQWKVTESKISKTYMSAILIQVSIALLTSGANCRRLPVPC